MQVCEVHDDEIICWGEHHTLNCDVWLVYLTFYAENNNCHSSIRGKCQTLGVKNSKMLVSCLVLW